MEGFKSNNNDDVDETASIKHINSTWVGSAFAFERYSFKSAGGRARPRMNTVPTSALNHECSHFNASILIDASSKIRRKPASIIIRIKVSRSANQDAKSPSQPRIPNGVPERGPCFHDRNCPLSARFVHWLHLVASIVVHPPRRDVFHLFHRMHLVSFRYW